MSTLAAPVVAVTVLEDRASVTRRGTLAVVAGQQRVVIERVSPVLADKTLTVTCTGARVLDARCERYVAPWRDAASPEAKAHDVTALRAERDRLEAARDLAHAQAQAAEAESNALAQLVAATYDDLGVAAARGIVTTNVTARLAELDAQEAAARARKLEAQQQAADLDAAYTRVSAQLSRAEREQGENAARLVIDLIADAPGDGTVTATYVVPGAAWRPYHRAQLARTTGTLTWETTACIWQATGEDWVDIELTCSLERPSLGVEPPDLFDDVLVARRKPDQVVVEARDHEQQDTGLGASGGPPQVPGIDDGGLGLRLSAGNVTVRADGTPHRVAVGGFTAPAQVALVAIPLRSPWVHVRARASNTGSTPLLAGPVDLIMAAGYVGRADIDFVAPGETFEVGFGPESDVRAHRSEDRERDDAGILGGWNVQTVRIAVRLSNLGAQRREVTVTERVPVSEIEQVEIVTSGPEAYKLKDDNVQVVTARTIDDNGLVSWTVELPAHGRRAVTLEYKVKSQRGVAGI